MSAKNDVPQHIAIIMDGNGRWARQKNLPRIAGHKKGAEVVKKIAKYCGDRGVKFLTLYTFSTENWKRPEAEVNFLMRLLGTYLKREINTLLKNNVRLSVIGDIAALPQKAREIIEYAQSATNKNTGLNLILALNYGSRSEIIRAVRGLCADVLSGKISIAEISEEIFPKYLYTAGIPDPDLMIRTSGEMRISNFLLWQLSYTEFFITKKFWPDFDEQELDLAISDFQDRKRRFGAI